MDEDDIFMNDDIQERINGIIESRVVIKRFEYDAECFRIEACQQASAGC